MNNQQRQLADISTNTAQRKIWVTFSHEGIHKYPAAASDPKLATGDQYDVSFLASPHRHIFHFTVWIDVHTDDRDIEFIQFKRWCQSLYSGSSSVLQLDYRSCEMMADDLYLQITARYPNRSVWISVSEDDENGCFVKYPKS